MGKSKKFKSFAEETSREIQDLKGQVGSQLIQVLNSEERVKEITEKCLKQLKESAGNTLSDFANALSDHEKDTRKKLYEANKREQSHQQSLNAIATKIDEVGASNSWGLEKLERKVKALEAVSALSVQLKLEERLNELEQLVMMGRAKTKKNLNSPSVNS